MLVSAAEVGIGTRKHNFSGFHFRSKSLGSSWSECGHGVEILAMLVGSSSTVAVVVAVEARHGKSIQWWTAAAMLSLSIVVLVPTLVELLFDFVFDTKYVIL
jgi:hypothetical protein